MAVSTDAGPNAGPDSWAQTARPADATAPTRTVSGIVTSGTDQSPLPGVTVLVKGTTTGSTAGADGRFSV